MLEIPDHVDAIRREGERMATAAEQAGPSAPVPSCPDWTVRDLVRHAGGVHRWATGYVRDARTEAGSHDLDEVVGAWPDDAELCDWLRTGVGALASALEAADPDLQCWTFLAAPSPRAMWARRQAHETAVHRVDAELAAGTGPSGFPAAFAADGIDELVSCFVPRPRSRLRADPPRRLRIVTDDAAGDWLLQISADPVVTRPGSDADDADCVVRGPAADLYLTLWNRRDPGDLRVTGDPDVLALFLDGVHVRWS